MILLAQVWHRLKVPSKLDQHVGTSRSPRFLLYLPDLNISPLADVSEESYSASKLALKVTIWALNVFIFKKANLVFGKALIKITELPPSPLPQKNILYQGKKKAVHVS